jgi:hypothetical protein
MGIEIPRCSGHPGSSAVAERPRPSFVIFRISKIPSPGGKGYWDVGPEQFLPYKDVFWNYLPLESGEYERVLERPFYSVFRKKQLVK